MANEGPPAQQRDPVPHPIQGALIDDGHSRVPKPIRYASTPSYESHRRPRRANPSIPRRVKETLDAHTEYTTSQDDGTSEHRINQYVIKQEIGRGSFGAVHVAVDQYGQEYAVKEFSKSRLRKRAQSHVLRRPRGPRRPRTDFNDEQSKDPLYLIREEIAIMKKLHHDNLVGLIEVLDDPTQDSLYMVMEMCKKGVIMKVGLEERADPYDDEHCRCWFRDLILGIEYLHAQGIVHRDIKPDNCLLTGDDVLKVVDFGVSEMFEKDSDMYTAKSAGSPAFFPPELCVVKHGDVSGRATDIWSMGVTLFCLRYGRLPFEKHSIFELYESIRNDEVDCEGETDENFKHLVSRILEKDPKKRIKMQELREHPWVTKNGTDPLPSEEENTAGVIEPPTEEEMNEAITKNINNLFVVVKAVQKFKRLLDPTKEGPPMQSILGSEFESHFVQPPLSMEPEEDLDIPGMDFTGATKAQSLDTYDRPLKERELVVQGYHQQPLVSERTESPKGVDRPSISSRQGSNFDENRPSQGIKRRAPCNGEYPFAESISGEPSEDNRSISASQISRAGTPSTKQSMEGTRGHARDPLEEEHPYLFIGPSTFSGYTEEHAEQSQGGIIIPVLGKTNTSDTGFPSDDVPIVSESPGAADIDIYETAYREEIERIRKRRLAREGTHPKVYLTRRVEGKNVDLGELAGAEASQDAGIGRRRSIFPRPGLSAIATQLDSQQGAQQDDEQAQNSAVENVISAEPESVYESPTAESGISPADAITHPEPAFMSTIQDRRRNTLKSFLARMRGT
ncbi:hypothetical protein DTO207G8_7743 [Paecilomyces variotii]|nr:hypothetical protein DTO032I3_6905 [Paecilomyces variotii]KAJ9221932.1 hypothetical protein DTO169C6_5726 [Paecilomyces variotii]KAJ9247976.1 hypothetical protein DTO207G8_7743 [Paecilomyces variotii]KAJ9274773.1 hypothetical protein DTO021D3_8357 [Paecilomyces variotii]KAJ9341287.1 hypothetical protein DTO027B6_6128 [Paecilomyces variotii]